MGWLLGLAVLACGAPPESGGPIGGWAHYGGDLAGTRYSPLTQIHPGNVADLEIAWTFDTGDVADGQDGRGRGAFQATPILVDDTLYFCSPYNRVFAIDAETGQERWRHDPEIDRDEPWGYTCWGVVAWLDPAAVSGAPCQRRIFSATVDARLFALDAATGSPCAEFGQAGEIDLLAGLGDVAPMEVGVTSPPIAVGDVVAVGSMVRDNRRVSPPGGVVRGFDARSGEVRWAFDPIAPGTPPLPPAPDGSPRFHRGTANSWSIASADAERDLLFLPMGAASPDFFGGLRDGVDYYANSTVALRASTGEVVWRFQSVHHDVWDYDVGSQPTLIEVEREGRRVPALAQPTKMAHVFVLDRETGVPVWPVEERAVPQGGVPGEPLSPTQPFPTHPPPLQPELLTPSDAWGITPFDREACRRRIASLRSEGIFTPPSLEGSIQLPGVAGGANWGSASWDGARKLLVLALNRMPNVMTLIPRVEVVPSASKSPIDILFPQLGTPYALRQQVLVSPLGVPCIAPPWGTLLAVDLSDGAVRWEVPLGTTGGMAPFPFHFEWGMPHMGGPITTRSGLVFIGAALDDSLRAFDTNTGEELWRATLPAGGQATPITYRLGAGSRQYVVIAAGGHATLGTTPGDSLVAFALP
jgi:quinoprotein glucose dehydrogenase